MRRRAWCCPTSTWSGRTTRPLPCRCPWASSGYGAVHSLTLYLHRERWQPVYKWFKAHDFWETWTENTLDWMLKLHLHSIWWLRNKQLNLVAFITLPKTVPWANIIVRVQNDAKVNWCKKSADICRESRRPQCCKQVTFQTDLCQAHSGTHWGYNVKEPPSILHRRTRIPNTQIWDTITK